MTEPEAERAPDAGAVSNGAVSNGAQSNGAQSNGAVSNGAQSNGAVSNGAVSNGAQSNGAQLDGAAQARAAMERAREGARARGATARSARQAFKEQGRRRLSQVGREPYGPGREPTSVQSEIRALFDEPGWKENLQVAGVTARWRDVVGEAIADHCSEVSFDAGVVRVRASSTAWATQLGTMAGHIRQLLNEAIGSTVVSEVRIVGPTGRTWVKGPWTVRGRGPRDTYG